MDGKSPADSDVGGAGPAPLRPDLDAAPLMEWADEDEGDLSFLDQFRSDSDGALG
jgi:hypothetical protein